MRVAHLVVARGVFRGLGAIAAGLHAAPAAVGVESGEQKIVVVT